MRGRPCSLPASVCDSIIFEVFTIHSEITDAWKTMFATCQCLCYLTLGDVHDAHSETGYQIIGEVVQEAVSFQYFEERENSADEVPTTR